LNEASQPSRLTFAILKVRSLLSIEKALVAGLKKTTNKFHDQVTEKFMAVDRTAEFHFK
jgi:hypothetical protein